MIVVLSLICGLSGYTLSSIKDATKTAIEEQVLTYVQGPAIEKVIPPHDNNPILDRKTFPLPGDHGPGEVTVFPAMNHGKLEAVAFETFGKGYGGDIGVMVGFNLGSDTLSGIGVTTMKETPGLGSRAAEDPFTSQFTGHALSVGLKPQGGDIDAVSGATFSSIGTVSAVQKAAGIFTALKPELAKAWN